MKNFINKIKDFFNKSSSKKVVKRIKLIFWPTLYIAIVGCFGFCGLYFFHNKYYLPIYVSGKSMQPTLNDRNDTSLVDFGIADTSNKAINNVGRFDVIITVYSFDQIPDDSLKIKRVWGLPGEHISLTKNIEEQTFVFSVDKDKKEICSYKIDYSFTKEDVEKHKADFEKDESLLSTGRDIITFNIPGVKSFNIKRKTSLLAKDTNKDRRFEYYLKDNEYFVMGDNWTVSSDCYSHGKPLLIADLRGVVVAIEGVATLSNGDLKDKKYLRPKIIF